MVAWIVLAAAAGMIVVEGFAFGRRWPRVAGWWGRAALLNGVQFGIAFVAASTWDRWMTGHRPWEWSAGPHWVAVLTGYVLVTFVYYWWHRARHEVPLLWRWLHQIHHSPQRIEVITSFYKHPLEIVTNGVLSSAIVYVVLGVDARVAAEVVLLTGLAELFYHWNVPTPRWLGFLFQRPESHCVHHEEGLHRHNYGDLPVWDMLFGTFHNPGRWEKRCGFGGDAEQRLPEMLRGVEVTS